MAPPAPGAAPAFTLVPGPMRALTTLWLAFLALNALVRIVLVLAFAEWSVLAHARIVPALLLGAAYDSIAATWMLAPLAVLLALRSRDRRTLRDRAVRIAFGCALAVLSITWAFVAIAELVFWNEFGMRFNFIAVDYLLFTHEVFGNIAESYSPLATIAGLAGVSACVGFVLRLAMRAPLAAPAVRPRARIAAVAVWLALPVVATALADVRWQAFSGDTAANEVAGNGYVAFLHAFFTNEIDYPQFYRTLPAKRAATLMAARLGSTVRPDGSLILERDVAARVAAARHNVVLVSIESLGADLLGPRAGAPSLTPNLDALRDAGLDFTHAYATGTRTVRGLEALTLSIPPTPGQSIVKRPGNANLFTLGSVLADRGYEPLYVYGGYAYFDDMRSFFGANGYTVVDRTAIAASDVHFANVWGVCDEDLFDLALAQMDQRAAAGRPFFAHVMTVSNHRPFTYPDGRVSVPSGASRDGAVQYTDYAIGRFVAAARTKPWFDDTVFVFVADHTHHSRGHTDLPIENFHIPWIVYAPKLVMPAKDDRVVSQMDVAPTIFGLLGIPYRSRFFGEDVLATAAGPARALIGNYQTVGMYRDGMTVELRPNRLVDVKSAVSGEPVSGSATTRALVDETIAYYQVAAGAFRSGALKRGTDGR